MKQIIIIEHLEPKLWPWCKIEYESISKIIHKSNLWFTNIKNSNFLKKIGKVSKKSIKEINLENACVLDPNASKKLTPKEAKKFKYFIIGGILGDYPPRKRTKKELTKFLPQAQKRNLGKKQFSTDNAVFVLKKIINGTPLKKIKFQNKAIVKINQIESIELPYYYPLVNGKPRISKKLIKYLKSKNTF
ncbi:MAG: SAM-dependent methyltransferase [Nanoarchaeota archaeon]